MLECPQNSQKSSHAAAGLSLSTLRDKLKKHGLDAEPEAQAG